MAQLLQLPVRFQFLKVPVSWALYSDGTLYARPEGELFRGHLTELDGWRYREEFFSLHKGDNEALRKFLEKVGLFTFAEVPHWPMDNFAIDSSAVWTFRDALQNGLMARNRKSFAAQFAPRLPKPKSLYEVIVRPSDDDDAAPDSEFRLHFELSDVAAGVVTITNAHRMLLATVFTDIVQGTRFKVCERPDCDRERIFPLTSEHERKYCSQYCGHLESVRSNRRKAREARKAKRKRG